MPVLRPMLATLNRAVLIVRPKQPLADWVTSLDRENPVTLADVQQEPTAYLVDEQVMEADLAASVERHYEEIFESELWAWYTDETLWPEARTFEMFLAWFEVSCSSVVFDLSEDRLRREK